MLPAVAAAMALLRGEHPSCPNRVPPPLLAPVGLALLRPDFVSGLSGESGVLGLQFSLISNKGDLKTTKHPTQNCLS